MISSQLMILATSLVLSTSSTNAPNWQSDYSSALAEAVQSHKPVAVLINAGDAGKELSPAATAALSSNFVCVYADVTTPAGRNLANQFRLAEGLVMSDHNGQVQLLRHSGKVSADTVAKYAEQYAAPQSTLQTNYVGTAAPASTVVTTSASAPVTVAPTPILQAAPVMQAPIMQAPVMQAPIMQAPVMQAAPMFQTLPGNVIRTGGCASGNCGR